MLAEDKRNIKCELKSLISLRKWIKNMTTHCHLGKTSTSQGREIGGFDGLDSLAVKCMYCFLPCMFLEYSLPQK